MTQIDFLLLDWIAEHLQCGFLDWLMPLVSALADHGIGPILLAVGLFAVPKTRKLGLAVVLGLLINAVLCNLMLKPLVARPRPYTLRPDIVLLVKELKDYSFPSAHTSATFAVAAALAGMKNKSALPLFILAAAMAFSRMYLYVHYPSDVVCGAALGLACGFVGAAAAKALIRRIETVPSRRNS